MQSRLFVTNLKIAAVLSFVFLPVLSPGQQAAYPPVVHLTAEQDHQRMMDLLGIKAIRAPREGNAASPNAANYDESKANLYPHLPDLLRMADGKKVTTAKLWWTKRRPEIVELFDREIYGRVPASTPHVTWTVTSTDHITVGGIAVLSRNLSGHVDNSMYPLIDVNIEMKLAVPEHVAGPVPVFMEFGSINPPKAGAAPAKTTAAATPSWQEQVLAKGWGYALLSPTSIQADNGEGLTSGIIGLCNKGQPRKLDDWGALRAWAWGASRALDYLQTDLAVNAKQVSIDGHSRWGKAALLTMAYDQRFAIGYISSSGEGGAKLHRRNWGEVVENLAAAREYHWMAGNFLKYAGPLGWNDLPVDSHELIALSAPRPLFIGGGATNGDGWADSKGMFMAEVAASPVYVLLGKRGLGTDTLPPIETPLIDGDLGFRQHAGGHTPVPNWPTYILFASRYLGSKNAPAQRSGF
ncbi:glucuronyl esterase domain-containing protein [Terriglobus sp. ADX1]|uniref:glucuronyl esterase domain-containing protein n=1 Tax=Terriglobus sp. ADX1 TaxID=2794063 RepID=UPI002FE56245